MAFPPQFAAHAAYAERVKAAMLYCCDLSPPSRKPAVRQQPYPRVVSQTHDIVIPQHSQKRFCRKIFCEEERRAFQAYCSVKPNSRKRRSAATSLWTRKFVNCLDEPENSLSPARQKELAAFLEEAVRFFDCQIVAATHSPFLLAMRGAKIYDFDADPVDVKRWTELDNVRAWREFFLEHDSDFKR